MNIDYPQIYVCLSAILSIHCLEILNSHTQIEIVWKTYHLNSSSPCQKDK